MSSFLQWTTCEQSVSKNIAKQRCGTDVDDSPGWDEVTEYSTLQEKLANKNVASIKSETGRANVKSAGRPLQKLQSQQCKKKQKKPFCVNL